ncbi:tail fiber domain-containing protein [Pseudarthrobacter sp. ATCC 49987]|uniref:tail fiber domain-containing protein n=1 Tax=Pseudarthrobacter sp. ATCC 49987 TaxID=2698204 RepID=UPI0013710738|nr:tail fiber domain-containing protein [Pseudarthrobacter sp. ATCC 49987]
MSVEGIPRSIPDPDPTARFWDQQHETARRVQEQERAAPMRSTSITGPDGTGIKFDAEGFRTVDAAGKTIGFFQTSDGTFVVFDPTGLPMARFGQLLSAPGQYGGEIWDAVNSVWVRLVTGSSVAWGAVSGKPDTYAPSAHTHAGTDVTSAVAEADGSTRAYNNEPGGTGSFYQVWVDANRKLCRNTSSIRYKTNVRSYAVDPAKVLQLRPVLYDRKTRPNPDTGDLEAGNKNEYGLIAEEVAKLVPELAVYFNGQIDGVRYDLLALALLDVVKDQDTRLTALEKKAGIIQ